MRDNAHIVVDDPNRILAGRFTVLGKAVSAVEDDVPVLARNKVLNRVRPKAVDQYSMSGQDDRQPDR